VSKMKVADFHKLSVPTSTEVNQHLTTPEIKLCATLSRVEVVGKCGTHVAVLLTAAFRKSLSILVVATSSDGFVLPSNSFVFAQLI